jgi:hypothetical protein
MATMDDQIHLAIDDVLVAVLVHPADVAGAEQTIGVDGVGRRIWVKAPAISTADRAPRRARRTY